MKQYTNFSGEKIEQPEVVKYYVKNAVIEIQGIDAADCHKALESLKQRIDNIHGLEHDIYMCTPRLAEYYNEQKAP